MINKHSYSTYPTIDGRISFSSFVQGSSWILTLHILSHLNLQLSLSFPGTIFATNCQSPSVYSKINIFIQFFIIPPLTSCLYDSILICAQYFITHHIRIRVSSSFQFFFKVFVTCILHKNHCNSLYLFAFQSFCIIFKLLTLTSEHPSRISS